MSGRRSTDSNPSQQPAVKVVGFHVEGVPPSPVDPQLLHDELQGGGGSPDPVIIPPSFQTDSILRIPPERLNTLPAYISDGSGTNDLRDMLSGGHAGHMDTSWLREGSVNTHKLQRASSAYSPGDAGQSYSYRTSGLHAGSLSRSGLQSTASLPPMTASAQTDLRNMALSVSRTSPTGLSPRAGRAVRSQPTSTAATPPVSPYRVDAERPQSSSYAPLAYEVVQRMSQRTEGPNMVASFLDGSKVPANHTEARRIGAEGQHTVPGISDSARVEVGTPRQMTGFHVPHPAGTPSSTNAQSRAESATSSRGSSPRTNLPSTSAFAANAKTAWTESSADSRPSANGADTWNQNKRSVTPELPSEHRPSKLAADKAPGRDACSPSKPDSSGSKPEKASGDTANTDRLAGLSRVETGSAKAAVKGENAGGDVREEDRASIGTGKGSDKAERGAAEAGKGVGNAGKAAGKGEKAGSESGRQSVAKAANKEVAGKEVLQKEAAGQEVAGKEGADKKPATKAERRALQEKQRAEKAAAKEAAEGGKTGGGKPSGSAARAPVPGSSGARTGHSGETGSSRAAATPKDPPTPPQGLRQVHRMKPTKRGMESGVTRSSEMFAHLQQYRAVTLDSIMQDSPLAFKVHPAVLRLGLQYASGDITGGNARSLAMLLTFRQVIQDYQTPESKILSRDLTAQLNLGIQFLVECRPLSISMGTAIKHLKLKVSTIDASTPQEVAKAALLEEIDTFLQEKITFADEQVALLAQAKVAPGDVVLTYAFSSAVYNTFVAAQKAGKQFRVVVVDSRPHFEGRTMLRKLLARGIPCTYIHLNALSYTMQEVNKVFLGASGAMSNGTVIARAGSAAVAMMADSMQRPVIICCETLKFHERVQLDSITSNELGDPDLMASVPGRAEITDLQGWRDNPKLELLNLVYDAMPCEYVTLIITEVGAIPPTSVPVILREYRSDPKM